MSLAPSKHISYHCRIASHACIIFPSAPLHTFNWQAGVNKIHTRRTQQNTHKSSGAGALSLLFRRYRRPNIEHINHTSCCLCFNWHRLRINYIKVRWRARRAPMCEHRYLRSANAGDWHLFIRRRVASAADAVQLSIYKTNKQTATPACGSYRNGVLWASKYTHMCRPAGFTYCGGGVSAQRQLMTDNLMVDNLGLFSAAYACGISVRRLMRKPIEYFGRKQTLSADGSGSFCECPEPEDWLHSNHELIVMRFWQRVIAVAVCLN